MRSAILFVMLGCGAASTTSSKDGVTVDLSSVTLAGDCGDSWSPPPPTRITEKDKESKEDNSGGAADTARHASCPKGADCNFGGRRGCDQTSMQLVFTAAAAASVKITKVELLDEGGKLVEELASRSPTRWDDHRYAAWDEKLAAGQRAQTSYALASPAWDKLGGRMAAQDKKFQLRVTIEAGGGSQTVSKQSIAPTRMEPEVMTLRASAIRLAI